MTDLPEYLTITQVAELLQVHPNTLRNWDKSKKQSDKILKPIRIGVRKVRRYKRADVLKLLEKSED